MDKKVILAVAGSGKTTHIVEQLQLDSRAMIVTYTNNNARNLRQSIIKKFTFMPAGIDVMTYFAFAYNFCYKPLMQLRNKTRGIIYDDSPPRVGGINQRNIQYYQSNSGYLYSSRLAKLLCNGGVIDQVRRRLCEFYDYFIIDEVQDFASHDFDLLLELARADMKILYVGDFYQHTFDTSRDGNKRGGLHKNGINNYTAELTKNSPLRIDPDTLKQSYRCSPTICEYISRNLGITIMSHRNDRTNIIDLTSDEARARAILKDNSIKKLFFRESHAYSCNSTNWAQSKGDEYSDTCIVLNPTVRRAFQNRNLFGLSPSTKSKFYVALTRAEGDVYIVDQEHALFLRDF